MDTDLVIDDSQKGKVSDLPNLFLLTYRLVGMAGGCSMFMMVL